MAFGAARGKEVQQFTAGFAFAVFTLFSYPLIAMAVLAEDATVRFWFGRWPGWLTAPIPLCFLLIIAIQLRMRAPSKPLLVATFVIPTVVIFLVSAKISSSTNHMVDRLSSEDCKAYPNMRPVTNAYMMAVQKLEECGGMNSTAIVLQECPGYEDWKEEMNIDRILDYLQFMEANNDCTGFCSPGIRALWLRGEEADLPHNDTCAQAIISVLLSKVSRLTTQIIAYLVFMIFGFLGWYFLTRPTFAAYWGLQRRRERQLDKEAAKLLAQQQPEGPAGAPPAMMFHSPPASAKGASLPPPTPQSVGYRSTMPPPPPGEAVLEFDSAQQAGPAVAAPGPMTYGSVPLMSAAPPNLAPPMASATLPPGARASLPAGPGEVEEFDTGASELQRGSAPAVFATLPQGFAPAPAQEFGAGASNQPRASAPAAYSTMG